MAAALSITLLLVLALLLELALRPLVRWLGRRAGSAPRRTAPLDPGRELRAARRAEALLRSCVGREEWEMYRQLGFIRVWGGLRRGRERPAAAAEYAYLLYPHKPVVAFLPQTGALIAEYCLNVEPRSPGEPLPPADDLLAKWLHLQADEERFLATANVHLPGTQHEPRRVEGDLRALRAFERSWAGSSSGFGPGTVPGGEPTAV